MNPSITEQIIANQYFQWGLGAVASSLALALLNLFHKVGQSEKWYFDNKFLIFIISMFFTFLLTDLAGFKTDWQWTLFQMIFVIMLSVLFAVFKGQDIVDALLNKMASKIKDKINQEKPNDPTAPAVR